MYKTRSEGTANLNHHRQWKLHFAGGLFLYVGYHGRLLWTIMFWRKYCLEGIVNVNIVRTLQCYMAGMRHGMVTEWRGVSAKKWGLLFFKYPHSVLLIISHQVL
ncbi:hypothetical protein AQUCO_00100354v1 [Aquilegia coerulea]|uniref:Uncharacterized protein n=1 Tax=Aquilegia coerulea TaxID=218851 RepID=A0A2G5FA61_AQUCA|nr:hypothetical protein AQUCO_00100354v1 [Aquilegia coerulea]